MLVTQFVQPESGMSLTGTYLRTIDEKQRLAVPKRLRDEMLGAASAELYIAPEIDRSLSLFAPDLFADRAQRLVESSPGRGNVRNYLRLYYSQAERVDVDSQGRIRIPERLIQFSSIQQEIVLLGVHDHLEIWDKSLWQGFFAEHSPAFDELARAAFQ